MIYNKKEFEKKLIDYDLNRKKLAEKIGINANTLRLKINDPKYDFKISEAQEIGIILELTPEEFMQYFFNKKLSSDESLIKTG